MKWFRNRHIAKLDGFEFRVPQPPKDWDERKEMTAKQLKETGLRVQDKANDLSNKVLDGSVKFSIAVDNKAK